jgi:hypothetical protein
MMSGTACTVNTEGSGGAGGAGGATSQTVGATVGSMTTTASSMMCMDVSGCGKCGPKCAGTGCGVPSANVSNLCKCNNGGMGNDSLSIYKDLYDCLCGADGGGGKCGSKCSKFCKGTGTDAGDCMSCIGAGINGDCKAQYGDCVADK